MTDVVGFSHDRLQARASLLGTWLDGGALALYSGTRPVPDGGAITDQVLLVSQTLASPAGEAVDGVWTCDLPLDPAMILASGTAAWARATDSLGGVVCDLDVGAEGSGAAVILANLALVAGAKIEITQFTIAEG